jgi:hypothetical protein
MNSHVDPVKVKTKQRRSLSEKLFGPKDIQDGKGSNYRSEDTNYNKRHEVSEFEECKGEEKRDHDSQDDHNQSHLGIRLPESSNVTLKKAVNLPNRPPPRNASPSPNDLEAVSGEQPKAKAVVDAKISLKSAQKHVGNRSPIDVVSTNPAVASNDSKIGQNLLKPTVQREKLLSKQESTLSERRTGRATPQGQNATIEAGTGMHSLSY